MIKSGFNWIWYSQHSDLCEDFYYYNWMNSHLEFDIFNNQICVKKILWVNGLHWNLIVSGWSDFCEEEIVSWGVGGWMGEWVGVWAQMGLIFFA
jgi:hypothetical protein